MYQVVDKGGETGPRAFVPLGKSPHTVKYSLRRSFSRPRYTSIGRAHDMKANDCAEKTLNGVHPVLVDAMLMLVSSYFRLRWCVFLRLPVRAAVQMREECIVDISVVYLHG